MVNATTTTTNGTTSTTASTETKHIVLENGVKMFYCWTHGLGKNWNHTSATCKNKAEGHKDEATADNTMGGNDRIMTGRNKAKAKKDE